MVISNMTEKKFELFYFRNKTEKTIFYILVVITLIIFAAGIYFYLISDPEALKVQGIALLVTIACIIFGPALVFETYMLWEIIKQGATVSTIIMYILICSYINKVISKYGLLGAWILFRKR